MSEVKKKKAAGGPSAAIAAIKARQAALKAQEDAIKAQEEEERLAEEAEKKLQEEAGRESREAKEKKREKERAKKERLKKEGKLLSKTEKDKLEREKLKLAQLMQAGIVAPPIPDGETERPLYAKKKRSGPKKVFGQGPKNVTELDIVADIETTQLAQAMDDLVVDDTIPDNWDDLLSDSDFEISEPDIESIEEKNEVNAGKMDAMPIVVNSKSEKVDSTKEQLAKNTEELRSPICCVLGHVDTGKTKLLDKIRQTSVQEGEAGGITQQIGATYFPIDAILQKTATIGKKKEDFKVPGLLVIDTPGHESFSNLRSRGSSLCNIAVLVVDIMHGLEAQTLESIQLLKMRKTPFIVALNKIDRLYDWVTIADAGFEETFNAQKKHTKQEFKARLEKTKLAFSELGLNTELYCDNADVKRTVSLVPTSAITGEGIPDLLALLVELTQTRMSDTLTFDCKDFECTVLEVKVIEGFGTTMDVVLSNGILREGDRVAVCGLNGPILTTVRALLTPQPMKELRIKGVYVHLKEVKAALGVKIAAPDLEKAVPGSRLLRVEPGQQEEDIANTVMADLEAILGTVDPTAKGVSVQASTLGSLEALLAFLKDMKIPVAAIHIGPVHKRDVIKTAVMFEQGAPEYAVMLCFDVKVDKEAADLAAEIGIRIFQADIIYHLFDMFTSYMTSIHEQKKKQMTGTAVFPCQLKIVPGCVFNKRDPIICGVDVLDGILKLGTPLVVAPSASNGLTEPLRIGKVTSIELNHKPVESVRKGSPSVAIKIETENQNDSAKMVGRHFLETDPLISRLSRNSIDLLKEHFRDDLSKDDWNLVRRLKPVFNIP